LLIVGCGPTDPHKKEGRRGKKKRLPSLMLRFGEKKGAKKGKKRGKRKEGPPSSFLRARRKGPWKDGGEKEKKKRKKGRGKPRTAAGSWPWTGRNEKKKKAKGKKERGGGGRGPSFVPK